ncbi:Protein hunchback [Camponotus japonicus]
MTEKHGYDDSGIGCSPQSIKLDGERNETPSLPNYFQQSPTTESTNLNYSELIKTETEAFRKRGDVDHVFTGSVKCELCDFKPTRLFQYYHHIIVHCKRTNDSESEIDPAPALNTESLYNEDNFPEEIRSKKKKRRKNIKPKRCKLRDCDFVTTEGSDVTEMKKELWMHMRKNHKYPLACRLCPFVTEPKHHMVYHWLGDHTKLRPFKCEEANCSYSCVAKSMLNSHVVRHWNVHQYNCKDCPFKARLLHAMKKHMREKNHTHVLVLNEDGTQNETAVIDVYSKKRGPRRNTVAKNHDKSDQSDLNQSSSSTASPEPQVSLEPLVSHSQAQQQQQSVEFDNNINSNDNQSNFSTIHSMALKMLHNLNNLISDTILNWKNNQNPTCWNYLTYMFKHIFGENVISYMNIEMINDPQDRLDYLFFMQKTVDFYIDNLSKIDRNNFEIINNSGAGPSNDKIDVNHTHKLAIFDGLEYQLETQNISTIGRANLETSNSEIGPIDYKKYINPTSTSNKRKAESEELDDVAMTSNNYFNLTNNNETDSSNKISDEISTSEKLESQPQMQSDKILNQPLSISKFKITGATKRKSKTQIRFVVEENTERNKIASFESPNSEYDLQKKSQINVTVNNVNLNNCKYCDLTFGNKFMHVMHMQFHTINEPYTCNACGAKCADSLTFNSHLIYGKH